MKTVRSFLTDITDVSETLAQFEGEMDDRRGKLVEVIGHVESAVDVNIDENKHGDGLRQRIEQVLGRVAQSTTAWREHVEREVKQTEFISKFDRSVIVMVYGKVNCGKSTLGNFIAGLPFQGVDDNPYGGFESKFRIHDASDASQDTELRSRPMDSGFPTDGTECTSEIQEFTLGGLSWVDTPGIHAMTHSNQALAREYVEAAELVVYLTSSDSPARASDIAEMKRLLDRGKPTLVAVTKFDEVEEDIDPNTFELVQMRKLKPESSRKEQHEWVEEQVEEAGLDKILQNRQYSFLSTMLAAEAVERGDEKALEESGVAEFYRQLSAVLSRDAVELKQRNPKRKFNRLVERDIWGIKATDDGKRTLKNLQAEVVETRQFIADKQEELLGFTPTVMNRASALAMPKLEARLYEASDQVSAGMRDKTLKDNIQTIIAQALHQAFLNSVAVAMREVMEQVDQTSLKTGDWEIPSLEVLTEEIEVSQSAVASGTGKAIGGTGGTLLGAKVGTAIAPGIGTLIGGVIGGLFGGFFGGAVGEGVAGTKTIESEVGTNVEEALTKLLTQVDRRLEPLVRENLEAVASDYFTPLEEALKTAEQNLREAEDALLALRYELDE
jgi:predicted GTPase